jgi:hypothetical protein
MSESKIPILWGILVLLNSVLSSLPMFMMYFFEIPKWVLKNLDYFRSRFFWQGSTKKYKYMLARWDILCRPNDQGGLGILDLQLQNKYLLAKWLVSLLNTEGTWQSLLSNKYLRTKTLTQVSAKPNDSDPRPWRKYQPNQMTLTFGETSCILKMMFFLKALSLLKMEPTQDFGRIPS